MDFVWNLWMFGFWWVYIAISYVFWDRIYLFPKLASSYIKESMLLFWYSVEAIKIIIQIVFTLYNLLTDFQTYLKNLHYYSIKIKSIKYSNKQSKSIMLV